MFVYLILISKQFSLIEIFSNLSNLVSKKFNVITDDFKRPIDPETYSSGNF